MKWPPSHPKSVTFMQSIGRVMPMDLLPYDFVEGQRFKSIMRLLETIYHVEQLFLAPFNSKCIMYVSTFTNL